MKQNVLPAHAVILAGGRGTRIWPRSRRRTPKQLLNITGDTTMLEQTYARLAPAFGDARIWVVSNREQAAMVKTEMPRGARRNVLVEPAGRNTAAAIGLAAVHLMHRTGGDALMAVLPADHYIESAAKYRRIVRAALDVAARPGALVALGVPPVRPETGYGYIERGAKSGRAGGETLYELRRFIEKPPLAEARRYAKSGRHLWNAGMFFWRATTFLENVKRFLPKTHAALARLAETIGTRRYEAALRRAYAKLENISVDYAVLEPASREKDSKLFVLPAEVGWSDIGSWAAVYELMARRPEENVPAGRFLGIEAEGNFLWSPKKFVAAVGVKNVVVVDTPDALLVCAREKAQDVGRVVKWLETHGMRKLT